MVMEMQELVRINQQIQVNVRYWNKRNTRMKEWFEMLWLIDKLYSKGMETYVSNEPQTFYNMAHFLLTRGELSHLSSIENESAIELDKRAKINRACNYMWSKIDRERKLGGDQPFVDELGFYLLVTGWYSVVMLYDNETNLIRSRIWNPANVYPMYADGRLVSCVHQYAITEQEAKVKAANNGWNYQAPLIPSDYRSVTVNDYFELQPNGTLNNVVIMNNQDCTGWVNRPEMRLLVAPIAGFPDRGTLTPSGKDWRQLAGRGIFEVDMEVYTAMNKWKSMVSQILRDTAQPITQEFSATPQARPEQLRERGAHFHYAPGEAGIQRVQPPQIPNEMQSNMSDLEKEKQKGSFNDAVYGMLEGQAGYALSLLSSSSANQILYPYMDAKHFVLGEADRFWLSNLKSRGRTFAVHGKFVEKLKSSDIPQEVEIIVESDVATPKDWLERATIGNMLKEHLDEATIISEIYRLPDTEAIKRRKKTDAMMEHPMTQNLELISSYKAHAKFLEYRGDAEGARLYRNAAKSLEAQLGAPEPGQGKPAETSRIDAARAQTQQKGRARVPSQVAPPEARQGFTPQQLRQLVGRGKVRSA